MTGADVGVPPRSALVVPAVTGTRLDRAPLRGADQVVVDLEDSVPERDKQAARVAAVAALTSPAFDGTDVAVRVNGWDSAHTWADVVALLQGAAGRFSTLVLPKVESAAQVTALDLLVGQLERSQELPAGRLRLAALVESAAGLAAVDGVAASAPRLSTLVLGPLDLAGDLAVPADPSEPEPLPGSWREDALRRLVLAGRAHGLAVLDGPSFAIDDPVATGQAARRARALGCDGAWAVHPAQLSAVHAAFAPSPAELERARAVVALLGQDTAVGRLDGRMVDTADLRRAAAVLARAEPEPGRG